MDREAATQHDSVDGVLEVHREEEEVDPVPEERPGFGGDAEEVKEGVGVQEDPVGGPDARVGDEETEVTWVYTAVPVVVDGPHPQGSAPTKDGTVCRGLGRVRSSVRHRGVMIRAVGV